MSDLTDGKFVIQQFAAGEIVPGLQALDAVQNGSVDAAYTGLLFYVGKDPTFALGAAVPFMMNPRAQHGWYYFGGGNDMMNEFLAKYNVDRLPVRQYRHAMGRLVPQGDQERRRPEGPEDAHRRPGRVRSRPRPASSRSSSRRATSIPRSNAA